MTKTPARMGTHSSPQHPSTDSAAAALTNLAIPPRVSNSSNDEESATNPVNTTLFNYTLDDEEVDPDLSQNLLSPLPPLPSVNRYASRVVESQLTTATDLEDGDDDIGEEESDVNDVPDEAGGNNEDNVENFVIFGDAAVDLTGEDDAIINDFAADKYDFNQRLHHYMEYTPISSRNVRAVEYCCMTQANTIVFNNQTKGKSELDDEQLKEYLKLVADIPNSYFVNHTIKSGMLEGYSGMRGKSAAAATGRRVGIAAAPFARKQKKVVAKVRLFMSNFPKQLPSGKTPCDMRKAFIVKVWKADKIAQKKEDKVSIPCDISQANMFC